MAALNWQSERDELMQKINALRQQGICYSCHHAATGEVFPNEAIVYEDAAFSVKLDPYPRTPGHTIVVYKPHREDISELNDAEAAALFQLCVRLVRALKQALGAEKVYLNTMCDGGINHLHVQLFPRYAGDPIGSTRFVAPRSPLADGPEMAKRIRDALILEAVGQGQPEGPPSSSST
jgi:diadenosine tetraphosphate (Ap4A) HIT family hydrolase